MTITKSDELTPKPIRLWPGMVVVVLQCLVRFVVPMFVPGGIAIGMIGGLVGGLLILVWWAAMAMVRSSSYPIRP